MTIQVPGGGSTTGAVHTATRMDGARFRRIRERSLYAALIVLLSNIVGILVGWFAADPPTGAATRSVALAAQFIGNPWFLRGLTGDTYLATTSGVSVGAISLVSLIAAISIVGLILVLRTESPQVLLVPSLLLGLSAGSTLTLRLLQSGPTSLGGTLLLIVVCTLGLRCAIAIAIWMNEMRIDSAVQNKWGLRNLHSARRSSGGYDSQPYNKHEDLQIMLVGVAIVVGIVISPFVGERLWGGPALSIESAVGPSAADSLNLGGVFVSGFVKTYWIGGAMVLVAWGLVLFLAPPWKQRSLQLLSGCLGLAFCGFLLFNGTFDKQAESAAADILAQNEIEGPTAGQLDSSCAWFAKGEKPEITLAITGSACNESTLYVGGRVAGTNALPASVHPTLAATYLEGPILLSLEQPDDVDSIDGLIALNWFGGVSWTYECPGGGPLSPSEFIGTRAGRSSVSALPDGNNRDRGAAHYIVVSCGEPGSERLHYVNADDGQEL